jgi:hypothetical protein
MSELRQRPPEQVGGPGRDVPQRGDPPERLDRLDRLEAGHATADARPTHDDVGGYDADAQFKRPVPKPVGYLPDDTGGSGPAAMPVRERDDKDTGYAQRGDPGHTLDVRRGDSDFGRETRRGDQGGGTDRAWPADRVELPRPAEGDRADVLRAVVDRPAFRDPTVRHPPDRYGDPLTRPDGSRIPCFDGPPRREQTEQGWAGDCGIIAALGAVAAHKPEEITRRIRPQDDGSYRVTLSETERHGGVTEPTGRDVELIVTPELPVYDDDPGTPACAKSQDGAAWCAVAEKAFAGVDRTWTVERRVSWLDDWAGMCAQDQAGNADRSGSGPAPDGYVRLHQGTTAWERAEALTQLTGQPAVVREFPTGRDEWTINRIIRAQLNDGKPVLVGSRRERYQDELLPHNLEAEHVYEVTGIEKGKILLRNPWNRKEPEPMETEEFARNMNRYYSTLM